MRHPVVLVVGAYFFLCGEAFATPQFARQFRRDCSFCHSAPPVLNRAGEEFVARGYRLGTQPNLLPSHPTVPLAVWNTFDIERRPDVVKGFPGRVELISGGRIGRTRGSYFGEVRLVSLQVGAGNALLNRSGRLEDLFVTLPIGQSLSVTAGQFRGLTQVDVSRRLSITEAQVFSAGLPGKAALASSRLTALRAFSPSGRQPAFRLSWQRLRGNAAADGWFTGVTVPLTGELTLPFTDAASFELEARPKGVLVESFSRAGVSSFGGHAFVGSDRALAQAVAVIGVGNRLLLTAAAGPERVLAVNSARFSVQAEVFVSRHIAAAARLEDRTGAGRRAAGALVFNGHLPFGPPGFRQALRLQVEQRVQVGDRRTLFALSHVF